MPQNTPKNAGNRTGLQVVGTLLQEAYPDIRHVTGCEVVDCRKIRNPLLKLSLVGEMSMDWEFFDLREER